MGSEVYILKIYRRGTAAGETMVGTIEDIEGTDKGAFKTAEELTKWLSELRPETGNVKKTDQPV